MESKPNDTIILKEEQVKSEEMRGKIKQILKSNGISDPVSEVIIKDAGLQGEGFASLTKYVTVKFEDLEKKPLYLFAKVQTENTEQTQIYAEMKSFEKEARFFTDYLGAAENMCKLKGNPDFMNFYPKCYYADENLIVLENLVVGKGFKLIKKEEGQNLEMAKFAMQTLAKHHALGHVMIMECGGPKIFFQRYPSLDHEAFKQPSMIAIMEDTFTNCINSNIKILEKNDVVGAKETIEKLKVFSEMQPVNTVLNALKVCDGNEDGFLVLGHGDYWNNNMMILMEEETNKIIDHVIIDFQASRYNSPALDLGYYLFNSVQPHVRRAHLLELLNLYKDTLNKVTEDFGYPTNLTLDQIFRDFRKRVGYGFWFGFEMTTGPGMALFKDVDMSKTSIKEWPVIMERLITKWIEENPELGKKSAEELIKLVREYEELKL